MPEVTQSKVNIKSEYLYELLQRIKQRPGMYLARPSITRLRMFLMGYSIARAELYLPTTEQEKEFGGFQDWIQEKFKITSNHGWDSIILFYSVDEKAAFHNFFKLFEQFCNGESADWGQVCTENSSGSTPQFTQEIPSLAD